MRVSLLSADITSDNDGTVEIHHHQDSLFDQDDADTDYEQWMSNEIESLLESGIIDVHRLDEDTGKKVAKTDEEMEEEARDIARDSECQASYQADLDIWDRAREMMDELAFPACIKKQAVGFYRMYDGSDDDADYDSDADLADLTPGHRRIHLHDPEDTAFLASFTHHYKRHYYRSPDMTDTPPEMSHALVGLTDRLARADEDEMVMRLLRIIPVWAANQSYSTVIGLHEEHGSMLGRVKLAVEEGVRGEPLEAIIQDTRKKAKEDAPTFAKTYIRLLEQLNWIEKHPDMISDSVRAQADAMLKWKGAQGLPKESTKKSAKEHQMTVEMTRARANPGNGFAEKLRDYYFAYGNDAEVPVTMLQQEGCSKEQLWNAAVELLVHEQIDGPDLRAITAAINLGPDYHVAVRNPPPEPKTPREALEHALTRLDDVRIVADETPSDYSGVHYPSDKYSSYTPAPAPKMTPMPLKQTSDTEMAERAEMLERERREHPDLPDEVVRQIVDDHMSRENPVVGKADAVAGAFWKGIEARTSKTKGMPGEVGVRDKSIPFGGFDEEEEGGQSTGCSYELWGNEIARIVQLWEEGRPKLWVAFSAAGWHTQLTKDRLNLIASTGGELCEVLQGREMLKYLQFYIEKREIKVSWGSAVADLPDNIRGHSRETLSEHKTFWLHLTADEPEEEMTRAFGGPITLPDEKRATKLPTIPLERAQREIDYIEERIRKYRDEKRDYTNSNFWLAGAIGYGKEYDRALFKRDLLLRKRDLLLRTNPGGPDYHMAVEENPALSQAELVGACKDFFELRRKRDNVMRVDISTFSSSFGQDNVESATLHYKDTPVARILRSGTSPRKEWRLHLQAPRDDIPVGIYRQIAETGLSKGNQVLSGCWFRRAQRPDRTGIELIYRGAKTYMLPHYWYKVTRGVELDFFNLSALPEEEERRLMYLPLDLGGGHEFSELPVLEMETLQRRLDEIEAAIRAWRTSNNDFRTPSVRIAEMLGKADEYDSILCEIDTSLREGGKTDG